MKQAEQSSDSGKVDKESTLIINCVPWIIFCVHVYITDYQKNILLFDLHSLYNKWKLNNEDKV